MPQALIATDGTGPGTHYLNFRAADMDLLVAEELIYVIDDQAFERYDWAVWQTDGTPSGTRAVRSDADERIGTPKPLGTVGRGSPRRALPSG